MNWTEIYLHNLYLYQADLVFNSKLSDLSDFDRGQIEGLSQAAKLFTQIIQKEDKYL